MAKRKTYDAVHICIVRDNGPQCGYVGYNESFEAWKNKVPTHIHEDADGRFLERAWGPEADCIRAQKAAPTP